MDNNTYPAYRAIVQAITEHARSKAVSDSVCDSCFLDGFGLAGGELIYSNDAMSTFEEVADVLERLGILRHLNSFYSTFICEPERDYQLAETNRSKGPSFLDLLNAFIDLYGEFGTEYWGFGTGSDVDFKPKSEALTNAMNALATLGYAARSKNGFRWTSKAKPVMVALGFWPEPEVR
jgi:hypothetical protein